MAFDLDNEELRATRKLHKINDDLYDNETKKENNLIWNKTMTAEQMTLEEAINIVDEMYQDRYKVIEEKTKEETIIHVEKIDDVKFTNLEFASVRLLREVQSLQRKLENSIPKQKVKDKIEELKNNLKNNKKDLNKNLDMINSKFNSFDDYFKWKHKILEENKLIGFRIKNLQELLKGGK